MPAIDLVLRILLGVALVTSIIELGLTAYIAYVFNQPIRVAYYSYSPVGGSSISYRYVRYSVPGFIAFLIFCSIWSILVSAALIAIPFIFAKRALLKEKVLGIVVSVLTTVTMIFWLSGFAAYAALLGGYTPVDIPGATLAFAIIAWLLFLALMILTYLAQFDVLKSSRMGYAPFRRRYPTSAAAGSTQMSTNPKNPAVSTEMTNTSPVQYNTNTQPAQHNTNNQHGNYNMANQPVHYNMNNQPEQYTVPSQPGYYDPNSQVNHYNTNQNPSQYNTGTHATYSPAPATHYDNIDPEHGRM